MNANHVLDHLEDEVFCFPAQASGEELYDHITRIAGRYATEERGLLVKAVAKWLALRSEPRTMLAVQIAVNEELTEIRPLILELLRDVQDRKAFLPFYAKPIQMALTKLLPEPGLAS